MNRPARSQPPVVDDRSPEQLENELLTLADQYVDDWNADSEDMARELLTVGAEFGSEVIQRLNQLPRKHRAGFLQTLGKEPAPPQAAQLPLSVAPASDIDRNVQIPGGTQVTASTRDDETTVFELPPEAAFEATPAELASVYAVDPTTDRLTSHDALAAGERQQLFCGENHQQHALYLGDESLFELDSGAVLEIDIEGQIADGFETAVVWEYYGTNENQDRETDDADTEGWHQLQPLKRTDESLRSRLDRLPNPGEESAWTTRRQLPGELSRPAATAPKVGGFGVASASRPKPRSTPRSRRSQLRPARHANASGRRRTARSPTTCRSQSTTAISSRWGSSPSPPRQCISHTTRR